MDTTRTPSIPTQPAAEAAAQPTPQMQLLTQIAENTGITAALISEVLQVLQASANAADALIKLMQRPTVTPSATQQQTSNPNIEPATYSTFVATELVMGYTDNGEPTYKLLGTPWLKFGIKIWSEVLPLIGIDETKLHPGRNPITPVNVRALNGEKFPKKVVGLADFQPAATPQDKDDMPF